MFGIGKDLFKKENEDFKKSMSEVKQFIAKSDWDFAINCLSDIRKKEENFLEKLENKKEYLKTYESKINEIKIIEEKTLKKKEKHKLELLISLIKQNLNNKNYSTSYEDLKNLKENYIDFKKEFKYLESFYKKTTEKLEKIEKLSNTVNVKNFKELLKKIDALISFGKYDLAERGINEVKNKETFIFKDFKDNHSITRSKIKKIEYLYNKNIIELDKLLKRVFLEKQKKAFSDKQIELKKIFTETKGELESLMRKEDLYSTKEFIEKKIDETKDNIDLMGFLNKKLNEIIIKIKKKEKLENRQLDTIAEVKTIMNSIGENVDDGILDVEEHLKENKFLKYIKSIKDILENIRSKLSSSSHKKILNELNYLLGSDYAISGDKEVDIVKKYHTGMTKILSGIKINGYNFYGKVIGADKITGDTFVLQEKRDKYWFSIGDATGHGLRAGLIVSKFTKLFLDIINDFDKIEYFAKEINNKLKSSLKSGNFLTCLLFEVDKKNASKVKIVGMGHEPLYIYRKHKKIVEEYRFIGLAAGIRNILNIESIKVNNFIINEGDVMISYTDGIIESKNIDGKMYGLERFKNIFFKAATEFGDPRKIYDFIINDLKNFSGKVNYDDDVTIVLLSRDSKTDLVNELEIQQIINSSNFNVNEAELNLTRKKGKTKEEVLEEIQKVKMKKELNIIILKLNELYKNGEITKLKEEAIKYVKQGYVTGKINSYLKKAIKLESEYRINIKNQKLITKYQTLLSLYDKGDYKTVIKEAYDIISKNGNI